MTQNRFLNKLSLAFFLLVMQQASYIVCKVVVTNNNQSCKKRTGFVNHNGVELFFSLKGQGKQTIVFIHGIPLSSKAWECQTQAFCTCYRTLAYDLRGFGKSGRPTGSYNLDTFVSDLEFILKTFKIEKPIIVGHSFGGVIALKYAATHPNNISKLVLLGTSPKLIGPTPEFPYAAPTENIPQITRLFTTPEGQRELVNLYFNDLCPNKCTLNPARALFLQLARQASPTATAAMIENAWTASVIDLLPNITAPTLIMFGSNDVLVNPQSSVFLRSRIQNSFIFEFPGKGHIPSLTATRTFNKVLNDFIQGNKFLCQTCLKYC